MQRPKSFNGSTCMDYGVILYALKSICAYLLFCTLIKMIVLCLEQDSVLSFNVSELVLSHMR